MRKGLRSIVSQQKKLQFDFERIKEKMQARHMAYFEQLEFQHKDPLYHEFNMHGNNVRIIGSSPNDSASTDSVLSVIEDYKPNVVLLGEKNRNDFEEMNLGGQKYETKPVRYENKENLYAKMAFTRFFAKNMEKNLLYFKEPKDSIVYYTDIQTKRIIYDDYASAAHKAHLNEDMSLLFAKPETTLHLEDIALRFSLEDLQKMFFKSIDTLQQRFQETNSFPFTDAPQIFLALREVTKELHKDTLYGKYLGYQASLLKQTSRNYKKSLLITNQLFPQEVEDLTSEPALPEPNEFFRTFLGPEIDFKARKAAVSKAFGKDIDQENIEEMIAASQKKFNFYKKEKPLYENINNLNPEHVLEKFVILNQLIDNEMRMFLQARQNPLEITIFNELFKSYEQEEILRMFMTINHKYALELHRLQNSEIRRIANHDVSAGRQKLVTYENTVKKIEERKTKFGYQWKAGLIQSIVENAMISDALWDKIQQNINNRVAQGINQTDTLLQLEKFSNGDVTSQNMELVNSLVVEANTQLQLLKLPSSFKKYTRMIKEINIKTAEERGQMTLDQVSNRLAQIKSPFVKIRPQDLLDDGEEYLTEEQKMKVLTEEEQRRQILAKKLTELKEETDSASRGTMFQKYLSKLTQHDPNLAKEAVLNTMILGDNKDLPFDINTMTIDEIRKMGGEVLMDFDVGFDDKGHFDVKASLTEKEKLAKVAEMLKEFEGLETPKEEEEK